MNSDNKQTVYVRRQGRPLSATRKRALDDILPIVSLPDDFHDKDQGSIAPSSVFSFESQEHWFEIGFGSGEHLAGQMEQYPNVCAIGVEPFVNGVSNFLTLIKADDYGRIRVDTDDAVTCIDQFEDASFDRIYILNPDPWHKRKHHKRRIIRPETLDIYARVLKQGGTLIFSSDVEYLGEWLVGHTVCHPCFDWNISKAGDWFNAPHDWIETRYETKGAKGAKRQAYFVFKRNSNNACTSMGVVV